LSVGSFTAALFSPNQSVRDSIGLALEGQEDIRHIGSLPDYPRAEQLEEIRAVEGACVVFLDFSEEVRASEIAEDLDRAFSGVRVVAVVGGDSRVDMLKLMQLGVREVLTAPFCTSDSYQRLQSLDTHTTTGRAGGETWAPLCVSTRQTRLGRYDARVQLRSCHL